MKNISGIDGLVRPFGASSSKRRVTHGLRPGDILFAAARLADGGENPPKSLPRQRLTNPL
jgi:hypothetical protein